MAIKPNQIDVRNSPAIKRIIEQIKEEAASNVSPTMYNRMYNRHSRS